MKEDGSLSSSWPGLSRPSTSYLHNAIVQIGPVGILDDNFPDLPGARPVLNVVFALDGVTDVIERFEIDEALQSVASCKSLDEAASMLINAADKITRHANIQNAVWFIRQDVNVATSHEEIMKDVDGRDKPGHDGVIFGVSL